MKLFLTETAEKIGGRMAHIEQSYKLSSLMPDSLVSFSPKHQHPRIISKLLTNKSDAPGIIFEGYLQAQKFKESVWGEIYQR